MADVDWSDPAAARAAVTILAEELATVTPAMLEAASRAAYAVIVECGEDGRRRLRACTEAELHTAIWRAMLAVKLTEPA